MIHNTNNLYKVRRGSFFTKKLPINTVKEPSLQKGFQIV